MHEMALCQSVIDIIEEEAKRHAFSHVRGIWLEIGALSPVDPEALRFGFDVVSRNTLADGAHLEIVGVPGSGWQETTSVPANSCKIPDNLDHHHRRATTARNRREEMIVKG